MHIGFDARIHYYNKSGISRYIKGLLSEYITLDAAKQDRLTLLQYRKDRLPIVSSPLVSTKYMYTPSHFRFERCALYFDSCGISDIDLIHCLDFYAPYPASYKLLNTAYDLHFLKDPSSMSKDSYRHYKAFRKSCLKAFHTVAISKSTEKDLIELTDTEQADISVIYPGFDPLSVSSTPAEIENVRRKYKLSAPPVLMVGTIEPRKNYDRALKAYELTANYFKKDMPQLCIAGAQGYLSESFLQSINKSSQKQNIVYAGAVTDQELAALYSYSRILLYPSLYEGFGFPVLEGFASRTAVITSNTSSMKEIGHDAACLVDPEDTEDIVKAITRLLEDLEYYNLLIEKGLERVRHFSWTRCAMEMRNVYSKITGC